ncbi:MAG: hypothetical protein ACI3YA_01175, partial [Alloprevotella sp.]
RRQAKVSANASGEQKLVFLFCLPEPQANLRRQAKVSANASGEQKLVFCFAYPSRSKTQPPIYTHFL